MHQLRKTILQTLYEKDARSPLKALDYEDLAQQMGISWEEIRLEVSYLEEKGYIVLRSRQIRTRIFRTLYLTAKGIDLVEEEGTDKVEVLHRQLDQRYSNLQYLEEQAAIYGAGEVPLRLHNQIKIEQQTIYELEAKLRGLEGE